MLENLNLLTVYFYYIYYDNGVYCATFSFKFGWNVGEKIANADLATEILLIFAKIVDIVSRRTVG